MHDRCRHDAEQRQARGEIRRAVHRVHDEGEVGPGERAQDRRISRRGFLTDDDATRKALPEMAVDHPFRRLVGFGDEIERPGFHAHVASGEIAEAGHHLRAGGGAQQRCKLGEVLG